MTTSIAQTRQQLSAIIEAAQLAPQVITKHNAPVAVLVSAEYFNACTAPLPPVSTRLYDRLQALRAQHVPTDNAGLEAVDAPKKAWNRNNPFAEGTA